MPIKRNQLTPVEWEIMDTIWQLEGAPSVRDVMDSAYSGGEKAYTTVQTVMNTLEKKGFLSRKKIGMVNFYRPVFSRHDLVKKEMATLMKRVFKGSAPAMASYLINSDEISTQELDAIKELLNKKERELKEMS